MSIRKPIAILGVVALLCGALGACTTWRTEKTVSLPARPMVYPLAVKLMDVNWVKQELGRIPLLIEETRAGERITGVRVEPTGDIRLPGMTDSAFRWKLLSCNATRINEPYKLRLRLILERYSGAAKQYITAGGITTYINYGDVPSAEWNADIEVERCADGSFVLRKLCDNISLLSDVEAHRYIKQPDFWQQSLDFELELEAN